MKKAPSERALMLDVNALLALGWRNHQFHDRIVRRLGGPSPARWATCALTQLGFVRLSCNPAAVGVQKSAAEAAGVLSLLLSDPAHVFIDQMPSVADLPAVFKHVFGHQQVTDAYLVGLARARGATLVTFDRRIAAGATPDVVETLAV